MKTYGQTSCPECGALHKMYRPLDICKTMPAWNKVNCYGCGHKYLHTDKFNNVTTEKERVKNEGNY